MKTSAEILGIVNDYIEHLPYERKPYSLYEPVRYVLSLGGKRIRPVLMMLSYELFADDKNDDRDNKIEDERPDRRRGIDQKVLQGAQLLPGFIDRLRDRARIHIADVPQSCCIWCKSVHYNILSDNILSENTLSGMRREQPLRHTSDFPVAFVVEREAKLFLPVLFHLRFSGGHRPSFAEGLLVQR